MPTDLDELLGELGRQADAIPLSGPDGARRRARQRTRFHGTVSVAAAVVLVAAGVGITQYRPDEKRPAPAASTPVVAGRPMPLVGDQINLGGRTAKAIVATDGKRAYTAWISVADNRLRLLAADLESGARAWDETRTIVDPQRSLHRVVVVPSAVVVVTETSNGIKPAFGLYAFDPLTGAPLWSKEARADDSLVFDAAMLVRVTAATGRTDGFDWVSGATRWSRTTGEPVWRAVGMGIGDDEVRLNRAGPPQSFTDGRVVLLAGDSAEVRDAATGELQRLVPVAPSSGRTAVAYDGWLFTHDEADDSYGTQHIRATDLVGTARSAIVGQLPGRLVDLAACGTGRVCAVTEVLEPQPAAGAFHQVSAIDVRGRRLLWQEKSTVLGDEISTARGAIVVTSVMGGLELFDAGGELRFRSDLPGGWLDARTLLVGMPDGSGRLARLSVADRTLAPYARHLSEFDGACASTSTRLVCAGVTTGLRIWEVR